MTPFRMLNIAVFVFFVVASVFYTASDEEAQGVVVMLLGILYFVALPYLKESK